MFRQYKNLPYYFSSFLLGLLFYGFFNATLDKYSSREILPFKIIRIESVEWENDSLSVVVLFEKNDRCDLENFVTLGFSDEIPSYVEYVDNDNVPPNYNREPGLHSLDITVDLSDKKYESVQLRTRHTCVGEDDKAYIVNNIFYTFERSDAENL